jgi:hypothetical protein
LQREKQQAAAAESVLESAAAGPSTHSTAIAQAGGQTADPAHQHLDRRQQQQQQQDELQRRAQLDRLREDPFAAMLAAKAALEKDAEFRFRGVEGAHGGYSGGEANQQLLVDDEPEAAMGGAAGKVAGAAAGEPVDGE